MSEVVIGWCARCWAGLGLENLYLGRNDTLYTHLGCFGGPAGAGGSRRASGRASQMSGFQIRQVVPVGLARARFCSWARWARFFIEKNMYCSTHGVFTYNLPFLKSLGKWEWMDGIGWVRMTSSQLGKHSHLGLGFGAGIAGLV